MFARHTSRLVHIGRWSRTLDSGRLRCPDNRQRLREIQSVLAETRFVDVKDLTDSQIVIHSILVVVESDAAIFEIIILNLPHLLAPARKRVKSRGSGAAHPGLVSAASASTVHAKVIHSMASPRRHMEKLACQPCPGWHDDFPGTVSVANLRPR